MPKDEYNDIFEKLVTDDNPVGFIAYSLYKREKRKEVIKLKKKGENPTEDDIKKIESVLSNQLDAFREQANKLLGATFEEIIVQQRDRIYNNYFKNLEFEILKKNYISLELKSDSIQQKIENLGPKKKFKERLLENFIFRFIWLLIIVIISLVIYHNSDKLKQIGETVSNAVINE